ncbi:MAG: LutB/LldF family L-lactate oxidation iron-sulfur protein [Armatimonadetes bacterium]|nr:LutB/LldF family L-lactate oxidation iron-sulfur protein [Armatimonadota bacterium]MDW8153634.1 LutB/LldF family L-lactate oxidation iron-sulfur protein [Armatimonadota bacterium]
MSGRIRFRECSVRALQDVRLREALRRATEDLRGKWTRATQELPHFEALRDRAKQIKMHTLLHLDRYLEQLEAQVQARGGVVHWARDAPEACAVVVEICRSAGARTAVKSKSMLTEEIGLNRALMQAGIRVVETDLGEFVVQLDEDRPSHLIAPIIHKRREDVAELFSRHLGTPAHAPVEVLTRAARAHLRQVFLTADVGITGANFLVAETGSVVLVENEGNARMVTTLPRVHIAVAGIEKVIPRLRDLAVFLPLLVRSATGQKLSSYISVISGPRRPTEADGPGEFHLVLVDNRRTAVLADPDLREVLQCLRCGACLNACPVYERVGGHTYGWVYGGPIGAVLTPQLVGISRAPELPYASTLCGACREVCPVRIDIPRMLVHLRARVVSSGGVGLAERLAMRTLGWVLRSPGRYRLGSRLARAVWRVWGDRPIRALGGLRQAWTHARDFPPPASRTFRERWRKWRKPDRRS